MFVPPGGGPPPHRHDFEEMFHVLEGEVEVTFRGVPAVARRRWQVFFKTGMHGAKVEFGPQILRFFLRPTIIAGVCCYAVATTSYLVILSKIPLSQAYPLVSISYLIIVLVGTGLSGQPFEVPYIQAIALWGLVAASTVTVMQRFATVYRQARTEEPVAGTVPR